MKFFRTKTIVSKEGHRHFRRFIIFECKWFGVYVHTIYRKDEDLHMHNHPWNMWTMVLSGSYWERKKPFHHCLPGDCLLQNFRKGFRFYKAFEDYHKIVCVTDEKPVWTIAFVGRRINPRWGYLLPNPEGGSRRIPNDIYREMKHTGAFNNKTPT